MIHLEEYSRTSILINNNRKQNELRVGHRVAPSSTTSSTANNTTSNTNNSSINNNTSDYNPSNSQKRSENNNNNNTNPANTHSKVNDSNTSADATKIVKLIEDFFSFPYIFGLSNSDDCRGGEENIDNKNNKHTKHRPWWAYFPFPVASIWHVRRIDQVLLLTNKEAKSGLLNELSTHILIDCLLLTVTASPIYNQQLLLPPSSQSLQSSISALQICLFIVLFITFHIQLISILLNGVLIFTLIEIPIHNFREWGLNAKHSFVFVARVHLIGLYCFLFVAFLWPLGNYRYPYNIIGLITSILPWMVIFRFGGTIMHRGVFDNLHPSIKLIYFPQDEGIRQLAIKEAQLLRSTNPDLLANCGVSPIIKTSETDTTPVVVPFLYSPTDLHEFLEDVDLIELFDVFNKQHITMEMLPMLDNTDYHRLGISIGDRIRIQTHVKKLQIDIAK